MGDVYTALVIPTVSPPHPENNDNARIWDVSILIIIEPISLMGIKNNIFITYMLRYAALRFELKRVMSELYKNGERVILDYAKENVSLSSAMRIRQTTESMINTIPKGSMWL